jgi:hypothetical protein
MWHKKGKRYEDENRRLNMGHPSDGKAWKNFDKKYPDQASDARNVRIAIATDGFNPYGMSTTSYSYWLVFVIPLNLPWSRNAKEDHIPVVDHSRA